MQPIWKVVWTTVAVVAFVLVAALAIPVFMFWPRCDRWETVLASDAAGRSIVSVFQACTGLGTETAESIELKSASGERRTIFRYVPNGGMAGCNGKRFPGVAEPYVDWTNAKDIHISIAVVSSIVEKHETLDGMRITYELGPILSEVCAPARNKPTDFESSSR
jgi:hypothetical protein